MNSKKIILILVLLILLAGIGFYFYGLPPIKYWTKNPTNFEECKEATRGFIIKTLPAQCEFRGQNFVDQSQQTPPTNTTQTPPPSSQTNKTGWKIYAGAGFEVQYPENTFAVVQIAKQLPPDYKSNYAGAKLISSARVSKLGKQECSYGESGLTSVCKAEMEGGIEFIQVNASAQSLTSSLDSSLKTTVTLAGKQTVKWSIGAEGEGTDYYYIPLNSSQTLVVARLYRFDGFPQQTLFNQVLATLVVK